MASCRILITSVAVCLITGMLLDHAHAAKRKRDDSDTDDVPLSLKEINRAHRKKNKKDDFETSIEASDVPSNNGYIYMNVLGPYHDATTKLSDGFVVLKVGKASSTTLNTRMQTEYNAASHLRLKASWPRQGTEDKTGVWPYVVYLRSFDENRAFDALPYFMVPSTWDLGDTEKAVIELWGTALGEEKSLKWFASQSGRTTEECKGDAGTLGSITETIVVTWSAITRVRNAGRTAGPGKWTWKALSQAITFAQKNPKLPPLVNMKDEWVAVNDEQLSLRSKIDELERNYIALIDSLSGLSHTQAAKIATKIDVDAENFHIFVKKVSGGKKV